MTIEQPESTAGANAGAGEAQAEQQPEQSSANDAVIEAVTARLGEILNPILDKRFSGFQSLFDRKVGDLSSRLSEFQKQNLTPEEQQEQAENERVAEVEKLRQENQLLRLRADHADAVDLITGAMGTSSLEEQIAFIESKLGQKVVKQVEAAVEEAGAESGSGDVQIPNPGKKPKLGAESARFAGPMTDEVADAILADQPKGALARLFQRNEGE